MFFAFRRCRPVIFSGLIVFLFASAGIVRAQPGFMLTLTEAERQALDGEPGIAAAAARAQSLAEKSIAAGALPDPQLRLGVMNLPVNSYDFDQEPMTQKQIGIQQMFPPAGSRRAMREQLGHQSSALDQVAAVRQRQVLRDVREAWLETYYWQRARQTVAGNRELFGQLVKVTRSMYSVGRQNQQDMVRAELELSRVEDRLLDIDEQIRRSRAMLAQWVGAEAAARPLSDNLPGWQGYDDIEVAREHLLQHPLLLKANAEIDTANAGIDLAKSKYKPMIGIDVSYGQREDDRFGNPRDDFVSAVVMLSIPLFAGNRQDKELNAAVHSRTASRNDRDMLLRDLNRQLDAAFARWRQLQFRIALYDETIIGQSRIQAQATLQAYQNSIGDFADVMRAYIADLNVQLEFIRLQVERAKAYAQLDYLAGNLNEDDNP